MDGRHLEPGLDMGELMSRCDVNFSDVGDDYDVVQFFDTKIVKRSRKDHPCSECGELIPSGTEYQRLSYRFEGAFHIDRRCSSCRESAGEFEFNVLGGLLWDTFEEAWDNGSPLQACLNRLETASAKAHMQRRWMVWQEKRAVLRQHIIEKRIKK